MFPEAVRPLAPLMDFGVCAEYRVVDPAGLKIEPTGKTYPLSYCDKIVGFSPADQTKVNAWAKSMQDYYKNKCK